MTMLSDVFLVYIVCAMVFTGLVLFAQMNLAVYGRENISVLHDMVSSSFSDINDTGAAPKSYSTVAFPDSYVGRVVLYRPQADTNTLTFYWETLSLNKYHRNAVSGFITRFLGHEGEGSVMSYLQTRGLASAVLADAVVNADSFFLFSLQITLTDAGLANVSDVIQIVFQFTHLLENMTESEFQTEWDDYVSVSEVVFDYAEKLSPNDYAV